jgi:hypothetical protein
MSSPETQVTPNEPIVLTEYEVRERDALYKKALWAGGVGLTESAGSTLEQYRLNHAEYLCRLGDQLGNELQGGEACSPSFRHVFDQNAPAFEPEAHGLPPFEGSRETDMPLGVVVARDKHGEIASINLVVADGASGVTLFPLHNMVAEVRGPDNCEGSIASWVSPDVAKRGGPKANYRKGDRQFATLSINSGNQDAFLLRRPASKTEQAVSDRLSSGRLHETQTLSRRARLATKVAAVVLTGLALVNVSDNTMNPRETAITTAEEAVSDNDTPKVNGRLQAEQFFDDDVLDRSREAFDAYINGDMESLQQQKERYGYKDSWIAPEQLESITEAKTYEELVQTFDQIFPSGNVSLHIGDTIAADALANNRHTDLTSADYERARDYVLSIAQFLNTRDARTFDNTQLNFVLSKDVWSDTHGQEIDEAGHFSGANSTPTIVLDVADASLWAWNFSQISYDVVGHELAHYDDNKSGGKMSDYTAALVTPYSNYVLGHDNGGLQVSDQTILDGEKVTARDYGRTNYDEASAVAAESLTTKNPSLDRSTAGEQQQLWVFQQEQTTPGATAAYFLRNRPDLASNNTFGTAVYEARTLHGAFPKGLGMKIPLGSLAALLASMGVRKISNKSSGNRLTEITQSLFEYPYHR